MRHAAVLKCLRLPYRVGQFQVHGNSHARCCLTGRFATTEHVIALEDVRKEGDTSEDVSRCVLVVYILSGPAVHNVIYWRHRIGPRTCPGGRYCHSKVPRMQTDPTNHGLPAEEEGCWRPSRTEQDMRGLRYSEAGMENQGEGRRSNRWEETSRSQ